MIKTNLIIRHGSIHSNAENKCSAAIKQGTGEGGKWLPFNVQPVNLFLMKKSINVASAHDKKVLHALCSPTSRVIIHLL